VKIVVVGGASLIGPTTIAVPRERGQEAAAGWANAGVTSKNANVTLVR
jgi:hypothetical protein